MTDHTPLDDTAALRIEYETRFGKRPFMGWDSAELRKRIADAVPDASDDQAVPPSTPAPPPVTVLLICNHVYLPRDATAEGWDSSVDTIRYDGVVGGKRTRVECHPGLAAALQRSGQGEII